MNPLQHLVLDDYYVIRETGERALDADRLYAFTERVEELLEHETHRILIDARDAEKAYSYADAYRLVQAFRDAPGFRAGHVAIVGNYDRDFEKAQSLQFHFQDAGIDVRAFLDYDRAAAWLESRPGGGPAAPDEPGAG